MPDHASTVLLGKGKRVVGTFAAMIGAGMILDAQALWIGAPVMVLGALLLAWGGLEMRTMEAEASPAHADVGVPIAEPTESDS
jgi:hypothetical protein